MVDLNGFCCAQHHSNICIRFNLGTTPAGSRVANAVGRVKFRERLLDAGEWKTRQKKFVLNKQGRKKERKKKEKKRKKEKGIASRNLAATYG